MSDNTEARRRWTVTITEQTTKQTLQKEWAVIANDDAGKPVYGYTTGLEKEATVERKVYEQTVDSLDVADVINAVNGL